MLQACPGAGGEKLPDQRTEQEIAHGITGDQRVAAPGTPHLELQARAQVSGLQVWQSKRSGLVDRASAHDQPVEKRRSVQIQELAEELLVHLNRRFRVSPDGKFEAGIEHDVRVAQMQDRRDSYVEHRVIGVSIYDQRLTGNGDGAAIVADAHVPVDGQEVSMMVTEGAA